MPTFHFEVVRRDRAFNKRYVRRLKEQSRRFRQHIGDGNSASAATVSQNAWNTLRAMSIAIRTEEDSGVITSAMMPANTGWIAIDLSAPDLNAMMSGAMLDRKHANAKLMPLRECLNKIVHHEASTYRIDGRGAHFILLAGPAQNQNKGPWVAEFSIARLAQHCLLVMKQLR